MALSAQTYQFLTQQGLLRLIDTTSGPADGRQTVSYWLVPSNGFFNQQRAPYSVSTEITNEGFDKQEIDGVEYFLIPEESSNLPGLLSHYAQRTGVAELQNPSGGGVNRVRETLLATSAATVAPDAVAKYVEENDSHEEARVKASEEEERVNRAVTVSPAREPSEGKLVETDVAAPDASPRAGAKSEAKSTPPSGGDPKSKA